MGWLYKRVPLVLDETGAVFVEYVSLLALVSLVAAAAVYSLGVPLFNRYVIAQGVLTLPFP